jgi:nitrous oxidase accessory protein NosD
MHRSPKVLLRRAALVGAAAALLLPSAAFGQATRTWVSGVGDDVNPCSRTAPCKTFAGAISKTAAKGEINAIDNGGFGAVTITKSITIKAGHNLGGVLTSGTNGIIVNAAPTDRVTLSGLDLNGLANTSPSGIKVLRAGTVRVERTDVWGYNFAAVDFQPSNVGARLVVTDSRLYDNYSGTTTGSGVVVQPSGTGTAIATVRRTDVDDNLYGIVVSGAASAMVIDSSITNSDQIGVFANNAGAMIRLSSSDVTDNNVGMLTANSAQILSFRNNRIAGNVTDGAPTGTIGLG